MSSVQQISNYIKSHFTLSQETKEKISKTIDKIKEFIINNKSLIFFGLSVLFSYYMAPVAPASAFECLGYFGYSLKETFAEVVIFGTTVLTLKNILGAKSLTKSQDDKINYLAAISNLAQTYLCPTAGLFNAVATAVFIGVKTAFKQIFQSDDREIYFLMEQPKK